MYAFQLSPGLTAILQISFLLWHCEISQVALKLITFTQLTQVAA